MKKSIYLILVLIIPVFCNAQTLFRSGRFLHHSTGGNIWGPNGSSTSIPLQIEIYNSNHGYTESNSVSMSQLWWPGGGENEWEYWHRIFDNQAPEANILPILADNKIVVIKSCYPSSEMTGVGQPSDTLTYTIKSIYNYKWHWRHIVRVMAQHPENFFVIWTNAPLVAGETNASSASYAKSFCTWAKDVLAQGLDPEMGAFPSNVYVFDYFSKLTDTNGFEMLQYAVSNSDSHPNSAATALVAPQFVNEIFNAAIAYEQGSSTILSVTPTNRNVTESSGTTSFSVTCNTNWSATSNAGWCTVTQSGTGNGTIVVNYTANPESTTRTASIVISATGANSQTVSLIQAGLEPTLTVTPPDQTVNSSSETSSYDVISNSNWTVTSDQTWCTVTLSGDGNGLIVASYSENLSEARTAIITATVDGLSPVIVTLSQDGVLNKTLNLSALIEGLYAGNGTLNQAYNGTSPQFGPGIADAITLELHHADDYSILVYSISGIGLSTSGTVGINIPLDVTGNFYITVRHRNSVETTSANPVSFAGQTISYTFDQPSKAFHGNLMMIDGYYVIYSGDANQDGSVDTGDMTPVENDASGFISGYLASDINCDGVVDTADMTIIDNNGSAFIFAETP